MAEFQFFKKPHFRFRLNGFKLNHSWIRVLNKHAHVQIAVRQSENSVKWLNLKWTRTRLSSSSMMEYMAYAYYVQLILYIVWSFLVIHVLGCRTIQEIEKRFREENFRYSFIANWILFIFYFFFNFVKTFSRFFMQIKITQ